MKFVKLFEPLKIRDMEIRNRIVLPAMALNYTPDGYISEQITNFYVERAKGGVGLIIIGGCQVEKRGGGGSQFLSIEDDKFIPGFTVFAKEIHTHGAKVIAQLYHAGAYALTHKPVSSSAVRSNLTRLVPKELTIDEIKVVQENHANAADRIKKAGFDGVELSGSAGYLINQFLSPLTNKRTDEYGGSLENRLRYPLELIKLVKKRVGKDILVGMRIAGDDFVPGSNTYKESAVFAKYYDEAGIDYLNVTGGWHETRIPQIPMMVPQGAYAYLAENIRNNVSAPVFASNRITNPTIAEEILRNEMADAICMGRALIADAYLPIKAKENNLWDIRKCVGCNQGCFDHIFTGRAVECMRNYEVSREAEIDINKKVDKPMRILIIGSGNIIHNLGLVDFKNIEKPDYGYDWAIEAREIINGNLLAGDYEPLIDYQRQSKAVQLAIPTPDHYLPLIYVLGVIQKGEKIKLFNDELIAGSLSMTSLIIN